MRTPGDGVAGVKEQIQKQNSRHVTRAAASKIMAETVNNMQMIMHESYGGD